MIEFDLKKVYDRKIITRSGKEVAKFCVLDEVKSDCGRIAVQLKDGTTYFTYLNGKLYSNLGQSDSDLVIVGEIKEKFGIVFKNLSTKDESLSTLIFDTEREANEYSLKFIGVNYSAYVVPIKWEE